MRVLPLCGEILRNGFQAFAANPWRSIAVMILFLSLSIANDRILRFAVRPLADEPIAAMLVIGLVSAFVNGYLLSGVFLFHLASLARGSGEIRDFFRGAPFLLRFLGLQFLSAAISALFLVPTLIAIANFPHARWPMIVLYLSLPFVAWFSIRNSLSLLVLLHENSGVLEAVRRSFEYTSGRFRLLAIALVLIMLVYLSGIVLFIVGLFATAPVAVYMYCFLYQALLSPRLNNQ
jgi:hypothetical protein